MSSTSSVPRLSLASLALAVFVACSPQPGPPASRPEARRASASLSSSDDPIPPLAVERPFDVPSPNGARNDPYYWLRDDTRTDADVLGYLRSENGYAAALLAPMKPLEETLFAEMRGRVQEDDASVPTFEDGYWYYSRFEAGKQQPIYARRPKSMQAPEQVLLDGNELARGHEFYRIGTYEVSRDGARVAWADDSMGRNQFALHIKDVASGRLLPDTATNISPSLAWANDNRTLFYVGKDSRTLRADRVYRLVLGARSELLFQEGDGSYYVSLDTSKSRRYVVINLESTTNSEARLIDADHPATGERVFLPRSKDHLYQVDHLDGRFVMRTNRDAKNFRLVTLLEGEQGDPQKWLDLIPHRADALLEGFALYHDFVAASVRTGGLRQVQVVAGATPPYFLEAADPTYAMTVLDTPDPSSRSVRYSYDALSVPSTIYEVDVGTRQRSVLHRQPVPGYDPTRYVSEYIHATSPDGALVPVSLVYAKQTPRNGKAPLLLYGYGSYGSSQDPRFDSSVVSLLDRGWVYAIAHVRGGEELGRAWYEDGKLQHKRNTFTDFIAVTEHLVREKYAARERVFALGRSAGGMLMGAVLNMRPELYRGVAAIVPFVDVVTTMLDESIPLTTNEFDEWGNPKEKAAYEYMLSYSPYDNVKPQAYPSIYVQTGLYDSQVQYFEPAKWVAKLRANKTDANPLVLDVDMTSGHGGASGRFDRLRQSARALGFLLYESERPDARAR